MILGFIVREDTYYFPLVGLLSFSRDIKFIDL